MEQNKTIARFNQLAAVIDIPWEISNLAREYEKDNNKAIILLTYIKQKCSEGAKPYLVELLQCPDTIARKTAIKKFFEPVQLNDEFMKHDDCVKYLAWYIITKGLVSHKIKRDCKIPNSHILPEDSALHVSNMRALSFEIPIKLAKAFGFESSDSKVHEYLEIIKDMAKSSRLPTELVARDINMRTEAIKRILGSADLPEEFWESVTTNPSNSFAVGAYMLDCKKA